MNTILKHSIVTCIFLLNLTFTNHSFAQQSFPITIKTVSKNTNSTINCLLELKDISSKNGFHGKGQTNTKGEFTFNLSQGAVLEIKAISSGYMPTTQVIKTNELESSGLIYIKLIKIEVGTLIELENVNFTKGKHELLSDSYTVLDDLVTLLTQNPKMKIELAGHTDAIGGTKSNLNLSEKRVESVKKYLVKKGIKSGRIKGVGYGGKRPIAKNNTEEGRRRNRRVEFKVLKID